MKKTKYSWIASNDPLCDNPTVLVSISTVPVTFVFEIYYAYWQDGWHDNRYFPAGWRFGCNIWFSGIACSQSRTGRTTVGLRPGYDSHSRLYFDQHADVRASHQPYPTPDSCIEAAIRHVAARLDTTLLLYPDIAKYLLRPEMEPFFALWRGIVEKEEWLNRVRAPRTVGLTEQLPLFY